MKFVYRAFVLNRWLSIVVAIVSVNSLYAAALPTGALMLRDVHFTHPGAESATTGVGLAAIDFASFSGFGYVNISIAGQWVVQNLPVEPAAAVPGLSQYVNLPTGASVSILGDVSTEPQSSFPAATASAALINKSPPTEINPQGLLGTGAPLRTQPPAPQPGPLTFDPQNASKFEGFQPAHLTNFEQDVNQCIPAAAANSLDYIRARFNRPLPHQNITGLAGDPANSLVGQVDQEMGRAQGQIVGPMPYIAGRLDYLGDNNLLPALRIEHQAVNHPLFAAIRANITGSNRTSVFRNDPTADFILARLKAGSAVDVAMCWDVGGCHAIELIGGGEIFGFPWIAFQHDAKQGYDAAMMKVDANGGISVNDGGYGFTFLHDVDNDGFLNLLNFFDRAELVTVVSHTVPEPTSQLLFPIYGIAFWLTRRRMS